MKKILLLCLFGLFLAGVSQAQTTTENSKTTEKVVKADQKIEKKTCKDLSDKSCCKKADATKAEANAGKPSARGCCSAGAAKSCKGKAEAKKAENQPKKKEEDNPDVG